MLDLMSTFSFVDFKIRNNVSILQFYDVSAHILLHMYAFEKMKNEEMKNFCDKKLF